MSIPIHEKYMLTTAEAAEYFSIGTKQIRKILLDHPEIAIWYGNKFFSFGGAEERKEGYFVRREVCIGCGRCIPVCPQRCKRGKFQLGSNSSLDQVFSI